MKQELYATQLQLKTKIAFINELQSDVEQLHIVEDENIKLKSVVALKDTDLRQWTIKVVNINIQDFNYIIIIVP